MSKITVTELQGHTSGGDANKVKIATGHNLGVNTGSGSIDARLHVESHTTGHLAKFEGVANAQNHRVIIDASGTSSTTGLQMSNSNSNNASSFYWSGGNNTLYLQVGQTAGSEPTSGTNALAVDSAGHITMPTQPVFMAVADSIITLTSGSFAELTAFSNAFVNVGSHYNTGTGRFTAPVAGTYQFAIASIGNSSADVYRFRFYKNGSSLNNYELRIQTEGGAYGTNGEMNITTTLAASDYISIFGRSDGGNDAYADSSYRYTYFRGHLMG